MRKVREFIFLVVRWRFERFVARKILGIDFAINHGWMPVVEADRINAEFYAAFDDEDPPYLELDRVDE